MARVITRFPFRREEIGGMQMEEIGREDGLWNPQIRQTHDDGYNCYHILGFIAVLSLSFFPWPFLLRQ